MRGNQGGRSHPHAGEILDLFLHSWAHSTVSRTWGSLSTQSTLCSGPETPEKVLLDAASSGVSSFLLSSFYRRDRELQSPGRCSPDAAWESTLPVFRSPSALRKPARPRQGRRPGGCKKQQEVIFPLPGAWGLWAPGVAWCPQTAGQGMPPHPAAERLVPRPHCPAPRSGPGTAQSSRVSLSCAGGGEWAARWVVIPPLREEGDVSQPS